MKMPREVRQNPHIKVLYIEDDPFTREKLLKVLSRRFRQVFSACNGEDGYHSYMKYSPDIVITDLKMMHGNGLEMIRKIREMDDKVQIIVTTAHDESDTFIQSIEYNVNHFILKPIEFDRLLMAIQKSIYQIQLETELEMQKKLTRAILDSQDNLIFSIENDKIVEFNEAFRNLAGLSENQPPSKGFLLSDFFAEDPEYFYPQNKENWLKEFHANGKKFAKVRWRSHHGADKIFFMKSSTILDGRQRLFVCTDITELEAESKMNELLVSMDPLTNIFTRQKFDELLEKEINKNTYSPFSIIKFDVDHFNEVNKHYGYQEGDHLLCTISTMVQQCIGEEDQFARWDGDAFILLTRDRNGRQGKILAETIRSLIEGYTFHQVGNLTCSFGIVEYQAKKSKEELLNEAENALALSKSNGRNCCTIYTE